LILIVDSKRDQIYETYETHLMFALKKSATESNEIKRKVEAAVLMWNMHQYVAAC
jgi:hypothetical protein